MGVWYLYGYAEERKAIRMFSLSRMKNAALTKDTFILPKDFDYCSQADGSNFGVFAGQKKYRYRVAFYANSISWALERKWAADQVIEEIDDGVIITFTSSQYDKVLEWVLSRGCSAKPLEPEELVDDWKWHIKEMRKLSKNV
jgi:predicted DNA-binding transcriptional regulator YafY